MTRVVNRPIRIVRPRRSNGPRRGAPAGSST